MLDAQSFNLENNEYAQAISEGILLGQYKFLNYKSKNNKNPLIDKIFINGKCNKNALYKGTVIGEAVNYSRDLGNHPPNILTPTYLAKEAESFSKSKNSRMLKKI